MLMRLLAACVLIGLPATALAESWVPLEGTGNPEDGASFVKVVEATPSRTVLELRVRGVFTSPVALDGRQYTSVSLKAGRVSTKGKPEAPFVSRMIAIPRGAIPVIEVDPTDPTYLVDVALPPVQAKPKRCGGSFLGRFVCDHAIYDGSQVYPGPLATIEEVGTFRDLRFARVRMNPVQFDPSAERVSVYPRLRIRILHEGTGFLGTTRLSPAYHSLYGEHLLNYQSVLAREGGLPAMERILFITADGFQAGLTELVGWKRQMGFKVAVATLTEIGSTKAAVKTYLQNVYDDPATRPTYVILVGDIADMPTNQGTGGCASDFMYSQLEGDDLVSDILISRLSVKDAQDLALQVQKIISYESEIPAGGDSDWLSGATLISSSEGSGGSNDDVRSDIIGEYLSGYGYEPLDKFYNSKENDSASNVSASINTGRGFVNYLGHGSGTSWATTSPEYSNSHINDLTNVDKLVTVMDVSCTNGAFDDHGSCFAETWLRANEGGAPTGAVAIYSASTPAAWDEPAEMAVGLAKAFTQEGVHRWGDLCFAGRAYMMDVLGTNSTVKETCEQYVVFGDASLMVRSMAPGELEVDAPVVLPVGAVEETFSVTMNGVPVKDALVHLFREGDVDLAGYTNDAGQVTFEIQTESPGELTLVATAFDAVPFTGAVDVTVTGCGILKAVPGVIGCTGLIEVTLWDQDLNTAPLAVDTADLTIQSSSGQSASVEVTETEISSNQFKGTFDPSDSGMPLNHGTTLTVKYQDESCEGGSLSVAVEVVADCQAPVISNIQVHDVFATSARITWSTEEPASSGILLGTDNPSEPVDAPGTGTDHEIQLKNLLPSTTYSFLVEATDPAGNHGWSTSPTSFTTSDCDPQCDGKECGDDGCGGVCGVCLEDEWCTNDQCLPDGCGADPSFSCLNACGGSGSGWCYCDDSCVSYGDCCPDYQSCCLNCKPDCNGKECGDDGCGGSCGGCDSGLTCVAGACECVPDCAGKNCGEDGCGGECGTCHFGKTCVSGVCTCAPSCNGKECGDDGCGGNCGLCADGWFCVDSVCQDDCTPECGGKVCGDDGCEGSCGECGDGCTCSAEGQCLGSCDPCIPDCTFKECGDNGCGGLCGKCTVDNECIDGKCFHHDIPDCTGKVCGPDGLGGSCGDCPQGTECSPDGSECLCQASCAGKECGNNGCGGSCGLCPGGKSCQWNGKCLSSSPVEDAVEPDGVGPDTDDSGRSGGSSCSAGSKPSSWLPVWLLLLPLVVLFLRRKEPSRN